MIAWLRALWCILVGHRHDPAAPVVLTRYQGHARVVRRAKPRCERCGEVLR
jgi:hypothetical protein